MRIHKTFWLGVLLGACTLATLHATAAQAISAAPDPTSTPKESPAAIPEPPTTPTVQAVKRLAGLPTPFPANLVQGLNLAQQTRAMLAHLNEIVRYYRMAVAPIQKIGEPSDVLYAEQAQTAATQLGKLSFKAISDEAAFFARIPTQKAAEAVNPSDEASRIANTLQTTAQQLADLKARDTAVTQQVATAKPRDRGPLLDTQGDLDGQIKLKAAVLSALQKVIVSSNADPGGLQGNIDRLQHSVPELYATTQKPIASTIDSLSSIRDAGVTTQSTVLFQLLGTQSAIDQRIRELGVLQKQVQQLRAPLIDVLKATIAKSQDVEQDTGSTNVDLRTKRETYDDLTDAFTTLSAVVVPLSQELLLLEQTENSYAVWRASVTAERQTVLHSLLTRVLIIVGALGIILAFGAAWRRAAARYVQDTRRRRQLLLIRRIVIGFLSGIVLIFGFVTQFSSLATFAGFISAGIAVGLQTILLSVAAYFFIVGRYGVRVGDRITVAGVTGEVVEVGLVRFYMLELTGTGTELHSTGRIAVFANSVLFQTGTPLYKQIPGTEYAWHELTLKIKPNTNYAPVLDRVTKIVQSVFDTYKKRLEAQHQQVESWLDTAIQAPAIESRYQLTDSLQFAVLYPVELTRAAEIDQQLIERLFRELLSREEIAAVIDGIPSVRAVVRT